MNEEELDLNLFDEIDTDNVWKANNPARQAELDRVRFSYKSKEMIDNIVAELNSMLGRKEEDD